MARIRTIKPEFWTDEKLSECSLSARLLFIGLISFADDDGRMEYAPARLRMQVFPCGAVATKKLIEYIGELHEHSLIRLYTVAGKEFLDIPNFLKHQRINRPTPSKIPPFSESSVSPHGVVVSPPSGMEGNGTGKEGKGEKSAPAAPLPEVIGLNKSVWELWFQYRKASKKPIKDVSLLEAMRELASYGEDQEGVVKQAIAAGYQGLWPLKGKPREGPKHKPFVPPPDDPEIAHA
jgi:hypothetical protein